MMLFSRLIHGGPYSSGSPEIQSCVLAAVLFSFGIIATSATAQEPLPTRENFEEQRVYSPFAGRDYADEAVLTS